MKKNQKKALLRTLVVFLLCLPPVIFLWQMHARNVLQGVEDLGEVSEFGFAANGGTTALTHFDTYKRVSLILEIPRSLTPAELDPLLREFFAIKKWADKTLVNPNKYDPKPMHVNFAIIARQTIPQSDETVKLVALSPEQNFVLPKSWENRALNRPVYAIIGQDSRFAAMLMVDEESTREKIKPLLLRLTSQTFLLHYLTVQNLMWQKAKDYARGRPVQ